MKLGTLATLLTAFGLLVVAAPSASAVGGQCQPFVIRDPVQGGGETCVHAGGAVGVSGEAILHTGNTWIIVDVTATTGSQGAYVNVCEYTGSGWNCLL